MLTIGDRANAVDDFRIISSWDLDGAIGNASTQAMADGAATLPFPFVNSTSEQFIETMPSVGPDHEAIGRMAAEHFWDRGYRTMVYFAPRLDGHPFADRLAGFRIGLADRGITPVVVLGSHGGVDDPAHPLAQALTDLPRPVAVFAPADHMAIATHDICEAMGLAIPEDVAILGVDDDDICQSVHPPISSIRWPAEKVGWEAAKILDKMIRGKHYSTLRRGSGQAKTILFLPEGVVMRQSTDILAVEDSDVAEAIVFIRENVRKPVTVDDVMEQIPLSRRQLEWRFQKEMGRTIHQEIRRVRLGEVKSLLRDTDMTMMQIANALGFGDYVLMSHTFKKANHISPGAYRKQFRRTI